METSLTGKPGDGTLQIWSDSGQLRLLLGEKNDKLTIDIPSDAKAGTHWLRFYNEHGATEQIPFLVGLVPELVAAEPNDTPEQAQVISETAVTVNAVLEKADDVDVFSVSLTAGKTFIAAVQANRELASPMDATLQLLDEHGTVLLQNDDDHGFDPQLVFPVPEDGRYFVRIFAFPATPNSTIRMAGGADYVYRLTMSSEAFVDHLVPAEVQLDTQTVVSASGWNLADGHRQLSVSPTAEGQFVIFSEKLTLPAAVPVVSAVCLSESPGTAQTLAEPCSVTGLISASGEKDSFQIAGTKGRNVKVYCRAQSRYSPLDPVVVVTDQTGKVVREADDVSRDDLDAETDVTFPADGPFTISVTDRYGNGGERFFYVLSVVENVAHFSATVAAGAFVVAEDKPLEIPVTITRKYGFNEKLTVQFEGVPEGISVPDVVSEKDGDSSKKVTLVLTRQPGSPSFSGPVRIVCMSENGAVSVPALPPKANVDAEIWLTVVPPKAMPLETKSEPTSPPQEK